MTAAATTTTVWTRLAAPDGHVPDRSVALPLSRSGPSRPTSTIRAHTVALAAEAII
jgi:hypothetical protein